MAGLAGALAGVGERAHEENLLTLQREHEARSSVINMALKSLESMPEDRQGTIMQELVTFTSDPKYKADKFAKKLSQIWVTPVERPTSTSGIEGQAPGPQLPLANPPSGLTGQTVAPPPIPPYPGPVPPPPTEAIQANPPLAPVAAPPIPPPPDMAIGKVITGTERVSPYAVRREEKLAGAEAEDTSRYRAQARARAESEKTERADRRKEGLEMGLKGDDLANFVINKTIRDRATGASMQLVTGMIDGKPAYAWKDPSGFLREYTSAGPGAPLPPGVFTPKETGSDSTFEKVAAARQRIAEGKGTPEDKEVMKTWGEMHRPPQATTIYIPGMGIVNKQTGETVAKIDVPTSATRTMTEAAPKVIGFVDRILPQIDKQVAALGPLAGRWNEFMTGKVGSPNPDFTKLRTNTSLLSTLLLRMHVGARGGQQMMEKFSQLMDVAGQSPENLKAALGEIRAYAEDLSKMKGEGGGGSAQETRVYQGFEYTRSAPDQPWVKGKKVQ